MVAVFIGFVGIIVITGVIDMFIQLFKKDKDGDN